MGTTAKAHAAITFARQNLSRKRQAKLVITIAILYYYNYIVSPEYIEYGVYGDLIIVYPKTRFYLLKGDYIPIVLNCYSTIAVGGLSYNSFILRAILSRLRRKM